MKVVAIVTTFAASGAFRYLVLIAVGKVYNYNYNTCALVVIAVVE